MLLYNIFIWITHDEYDKRIIELKRKEQNLLDELSQLSKADETFLITSSYILELANRAYELFTSSQPAQKNQILKLILVNLEINNAKLIWKLKNFFEGILKANASQEWLPRLDSNQ